MQDENKKYSEQEQLDQERLSQSRRWSQLLEGLPGWRMYGPGIAFSASPESKLKSLHQLLSSSTDPVTSSQSTAKPSSQTPNMNG